MTKQALSLLLLGPLGALAACGGAKATKADATPLTACPGGATIPDLSEVAVPVAPGTPWFVPPIPSSNTCQGIPSAQITQLVLAPSGDILLTGTYSGPADFGTGALPVPTNKYNLDLFVAAFTGTGHARWSRALGGTSARIAVDGQGNIAVVRADIGAVDEKGGGGTVDALDADGNPRWTRDVTFDPNRERMGLAIAAAPDGQLAVGVPGRLIALDASGKVLRDNGYDYVAPIDIAFQPSGSQILSGLSEVDYGPYMTPMFVAQIDVNGAQKWRLPLSPTDGAATLSQVHTAAGTGVALTGFFYDHVTIGTRVLTAGGEPDAGLNVNFFVAKLDDAGAIEWARTGVSADSLAFDDGGQIVTASGGPDGISIGALDCHGELAFTRQLSGLTEATALVAPVPGSTDLVVAGSTNTSRCADCNVCFAPRPYLLRVDRKGAARPGFEARH